MTGLSFYCPEKIYSWHGSGSGSQSWSSVTVTSCKKSNVSINTPSCAKAIINGKYYKMDCKICFGLPQSNKSLYNLK